MSDIPASIERPPIVFEYSLAALEGFLPLLVRLVETMIDEIDVDIETIRADVQANDATSLSASIHRLMGSLGAISAIPSFDACIALNNLACSRSAQSYAHELRNLEQELNRLQPCLRIWLANEKNQQYRVTPEARA